MNNLIAFRLLGQLVDPGEGIGPMRVGFNGIVCMIQALCGMIKVRTKRIRMANEWLFCELLSGLTRPRKVEGLSAEISVRLRVGWIFLRSTTAIEDQSRMNN
jgi:hypothetical protein